MPPSDLPIASTWLERLRALAARRAPLLLLAVGVPLFLANFFMGRPGINGWDANYYFSLAAALAQNGSPELDGVMAELAIQHPTLDAIANPARTSTGRIYNYFPIGHSVLHAPATLLGRVASGLVTGDWRATSIGGQLAFALSALLGAGVGIGLAHRWIGARLGFEASAVGLLALVAASPLGYYWFLLPAHSHTSCLLAVAVLLSLTTRLLERPDSGTAWWAALGAAMGWAVTIRLQDIGAGAFGLVALGALWRSPSPDRRGKGFRAATLVAAGFLAFLPQIAYWKWQTGQWIATSYNDYSSFDFAAPNHLRVLFSPRHGLFLWHPALLVATVGAVLAVRRSEEPTRGAMTGFLLFAFGILLVGGFYSIWWFGDSFGSRPFLSATPLFWFGLAWVWNAAGVRGRGPRAAFVALLALLALWNAAMMVAFHFGRISRSEAVRPADVLRAFGLT